MSHTHRTAIRERTRSCWCSRGRAASRWGRAGVSPAGILRVRAAQRGASDRGPRSGVARLPGRSSTPNLDAPDEAVEGRLSERCRRAGRNRARRAADTRPEGRTMIDGLGIRPYGALDFLALGALVTRFDPGNVPFRKADRCAIHVSGGEFNVAANLADCFGLRTGIASAMVDYPHRPSRRGAGAGDGRSAVLPPLCPRRRPRPEHRHRVQRSRLRRSRPGRVLQPRRTRRRRGCRMGDVDWGGDRRSGVRWFHSGGIFASLSESTAELIVEGMQAARSGGAIVSFDVNFRDAVDGRLGARPAPRGAGRIVGSVDVLSATRRIIQRRPRHARGRRMSRRLAARTRAGTP